MLNRRHSGKIVLLIAALSCAPAVQTTPPPAAATAAEVALSGASVLIGAGDLGCHQGAQTTAKLMDSVLRAVLRAFRSGIAPHSAYRVQGHYGVLKLTLGAKAYRYAFLGVDGSIWDRGGGTCH